MWECAEFLPPGGSTTKSVVEIGLDLAKPVLEIYGIDAWGRTVFRRRLSRGELVAFFT